MYAEFKNRDVTQQVYRAIRNYLQRNEPDYLAGFRKMNGTGLIIPDEVYETKGGPKSLLEKMVNDHRIPKNLRGKRYTVTEASPTQ